MKTLKIRSTAEGGRRGKVECKNGVYFVKHSKNTRKEKSKNHTKKYNLCLSATTNKQKTYNTRIDRYIYND